MSVDINGIVSTLEKYGILSEDGFCIKEPPNIPPLPEDVLPEENYEDVDLPAIGELREDEIVCEIPVADIEEESLSLNEEQAVGPPSFSEEDERVRDWWREIEDIIQENDIRRGSRRSKSQSNDDLKRVPEAVELCAWYCPFHFFGRDAGIYIREQCILKVAKEISYHVDWWILRRDGVPRWVQQLSLLRAAFYTFYFHEQFHHKVEVFGFLLLVAMQQDMYRPYKRKIYQPHFGKSTCLEESLANADSYLRFGEARYKKKVHSEILQGVRRYLIEDFRHQLPGYREALNYLSVRKFKSGSATLKSMMTECKLKPTTASEDWSMVPQGFKSLYDIRSNIFLILPNKAKPIINPHNISPGHTTSTREIVRALETHHGFNTISGGKGSHVKMRNNNGKQIIIPGNRKVLAPGTTRKIMRDAGYEGPLNTLPDFIEGRR